MDNFKQTFLITIVEFRTVWKKNVYEFVRELWGITTISYYWCRQIWLILK